MIKVFFPAVFLLVVLSGCSADREYTLSADLDSFYSQQPRRFEQLFSEINMDHPGLEKTKEAIQGGDYLAAAYELLDYYRKSRWSTVAANTPVPDGDSIDSERLYRGQSNLRDTYTHQRVTGPLVRLENGLMDWQHRGPNDDEQWAHYHNRHYFFRNLLLGYQVISDEAFSRYFDATVIDWIYQNPPPLQATKTPAWDAMSAGSRMLSSWPQAFYGFNASANFSPLARIMMLMSVTEHAEYLQQY
ncbi:MAG: heparinase II/III family protein, partial [Arenicellales bacterium]